MEIYLIRHTTPAVDKGVCYGQADLDITSSFITEAAIIQQYLPENITAIYSSPLKRCKRLAEHLFVNQVIHVKDELKEINCGRWELKLWDEIPQDEVGPWLKDHINVRIPGGESYKDVFERVTKCFNGIITSHRANGNPHITPVVGYNSPGIAIVAHGGVIRSILAHITNTPLVDSFRVFSLHYGCVIKIIHVNDLFFHEVLSNIAQEKETHKPSGI